MINEDVRKFFIGRAQEKELFKKWLTNSDPETPHILYLYDKLTDKEKKGGVGKTWLLRAFSRIVKETYPDSISVFVDFFNINDQNGVVVAEHVVKALKAVHPEWNTTHSEKILDEYNSALQDAKEGNNEQRNRFADALNDLRNRFADALIGDFRTLNEQLRGNNKHVLIFLDTYEYIQASPLTATLRLNQKFPDDYEFSQIGFVIAGRYELDWNHLNWRGREHEVQTMPIAPFTLPEFEEYFEKMSNVPISANPDEIQALYERTDEGRPILIGLVNDVLSQRAVKTWQELISISKAQFKATLVGKINNLAKPIDKMVLFMAHVHHRFNFALLDWILRATGDNLLQGVDREQITQQLLALTFVRRPNEGNDFVLHDEMRPLVNRYCWDQQDPYHSARKLLSQWVIDYYDNELQDVQSEQLRQAYIVEQLYHKLYVDPENGFNAFVENFSEVVNLRSNSFAHALLREVKEFSSQLSAAQRYSLKFGEARLSIREESTEKALALLLEVEQEADQQWFDKYRASLLFEKGWAYRDLSRYEEAIEAFTRTRNMAADNRGRYAIMSTWLGSVYQRRGEWDTALRYYEESLAIDKELKNERTYATTLLSISSIYRLQGKLEEALRRAQANFRVRNKLLNEHKISKVYVSDSLTEIGSIHLQSKDFPKAEEFFQQAEDLLLDTGNQRYLATLYIRQGELSMAQDHLIIALDLFRKAHSMSLGIATDLQIGSLNKQGWIMIKEREYERAIDLLQQAIDLAVNVHDYYQQTESLVDLAEALARSGQHAASQQARQQAREICQKYQYDYLLGLSYASEGDVFYDAHNYQEAFRNYGEACASMTKYNDHEYREGLRKISDKLFEIPIPSEEVGSIVDKLLLFWSTQGLVEMYPDFVSSCQEVKDLLDF